jgi:hypothetical protein
LELFWVNAADLFVGNPFTHDQFMQFFCRGIFGHVQQFGCGVINLAKLLTNLSIFQALINSALVLSVCRVKVILDAVV